MGFCEGVGSIGECVMIYEKWVITKRWKEDKDLIAISPLNEKGDVITGMSVVLNESLNDGEYNIVGIL